MAERIAHRGPDGSGVLHDPETGITLAHRRLAIVDLSAAGRQPMESDDGRYWLSFNGEIYNHLELRRALDAQHPRNWRGHSDTETLLEAFSAWGVEETLRRSNGMFAIALWDRRDRLLHLARDRMGEKPLYFGRLGGDFVFTSELKALHPHPEWTGQIDRDVLALYFRHTYVPAPYSIHKGIFKLRPGHWLTVAEDGRQLSDERPYWSLEATVRAGLDNPFDGDEQDAVDMVDGLLQDAVGLRMMADVPLGAFLSGGYDSSTVVALMQARSQRAIKTFSIGFDEPAYDEAGHARAVAQHLGTDHTELYVGPGETIAAIPELARIWDEPFSDASQIPTLLVSRLARREVTVSLSGDGGDELFCGYDRYQISNGMWNRFQAMPDPLRHLASGLGGLVPRLLPRWRRTAQLSDRLEKLAALFHADQPGDFYRAMMSRQWWPDRLVLGATEPPTLFTDPLRWPAIQDLREQMMYMDMGSYLPDDILTKVDRASMAVSLEARVPLLDHRVVELAWRLPLAMKIKDNRSKWVLRQVLDRYVPRALVDRPKMGFGVPIEHWLTGPLRAWAGDLLSEDRIRRDGYLDPRPVRQMWDEQCRGVRSWHGHLWDILMFQSWLDQLRSDAAGTTA